MAKTVLSAHPQKSFTEALAEYEERDKKEEWYQMKNNASEDNHYDYTRRHLNFTVKMGGDGKPMVCPLTTDQAGEAEHMSLHAQVEARLRELGFKQYKEGASNAPNCCVCYIVGGTKERMRELAFGSQDVDYTTKRDNSHIKREKDIEDYALDTYEHYAKKYGERNVWLLAHLDETNPHFHVLVIPTAMKKTRGRGKPRRNEAGEILRDAAGKVLYEKKEAKLMVSFSGVYGDNDEQRSAYMKKFQTEFWQEVSSKYGLDRGDDLELLPEEERLKRRHKTKQQVKADEAAQKVIDEKKAEAEKLLEEAKTIKEKAKEDATKEVNESAITAVKKGGAALVEGLGDIAAAAAQGVAKLVGKGELAEREALLDKRAKDLEAAIKANDEYAKVTIPQMQADAMAQVEAEDNRRKTTFEQRVANEVNKRMADNDQLTQKTEERTKTEIALRLPSIFAEQHQWGLTPEQATELAVKGRTTIPAIKDPANGNVLSIVDDGGRHEDIQLRWSNRMKRIEGKIALEWYSLKEFCRVAINHAWIAINGIANNRGRRMKM